jgi:hypothetical protein
MFIKIKDGRVASSPRNKPIGGGTWLPYEEKLADVSIDHETQEWAFPTFDIYPDKVIGTRNPTNKPPLEPEQVVVIITEAVQDRLDNFARTRNYDNMLSACTYATSTIPKFQTEGQYCVNARDSTWAALYSILAEVQEGTRPLPSSYEDIEGDLPILTWPE